MKLLQVPNIQNYYVDVENGVVYLMRYGRLREVNTRTKYKSFTIKVQGKTIGTTLYRMMYGAINQIDITQIPTEFCFSCKNGKLMVLDRSMVAKKANAARKRTEEKMVQIKKNMKMIDDFYAGNTQPLLEYLQKLESSLAKHFSFVLGLSQERSEIAVGEGINKFLDDLKQGHLHSFAIRSTCMRYARVQNNYWRKRLDNTQNHVISQLTY